MGRFKTIAGYFKEVIEKQPVKIEVNRHAIKEDGSLSFREDGVTPVLERVQVDAEVDVKNVVWVEEEKIPFTEEEERARDEEEAEHERQMILKKAEDLVLAKKEKLDKLTISQSEKLLTEDDESVIRQIKQKYRLNKIDIESAQTIEQLESLELL